MKYNMIFITGLMLSSTCYAPKPAMELSVETSRPQIHNEPYFSDRLTGRQQLFCGALLASCAVATTIAVAKNPTPGMVLLQLGTLSAGSYALVAAVSSGAKSYWKQLRGNS